jgi:hypothetical protein
VIVFAFDGPTPMSTSVTPCRHLLAGDGRAGRLGERLPERVDVPGVVGEQHVPLERLGRRPGVVREPVHRQRHPLRPEQEQLLPAQVPGPLVERVERGRVVERERRAGPGGRDPRAGRGQPAQLPVQVRPDRDRGGELALQHRVVPRPRALDGQRPVEPGGVGRLQLVAQRRDVRGNVPGLLPREVERHRHGR